MRRVGFFFSAISHNLKLEKSEILEFVRRLCWAQFCLRTHNSVTVYSPTYPDALWGPTLDRSASALMVHGYADTIR